jgi:hypothetical protein
MAHETITKLQAAERQLRVAIRLFFERRDLVAVHTLAAAALGVLGDLARPCGLWSIFKNNPVIRPERQAEMATLFNEAQNFFKHADRDPQSKLKFNHETIKFYLYDAASLYMQLTGQQFQEIIVLRTWLAAKCPDLFVEGAFKDKEQERIASLVARRIDPDDYQLFLDLIGN